VNEQSYYDIEPQFEEKYSRSLHDKTHRIKVLNT